MGLSFSLKKSFPGHKTEVELSIGEEVIVLFGPSGAGKSLILKLISGIIKPDEGLVAVDSEKLFDSRNNIDIPIRLRKIGYLFQDYALFPHMTVYENIAYGITNLSVPLARQTGMKGMGIGQKVRELMELMRLEGLENRYPNELSGGQKQRTALARTLAAEPRILLLDEPFSALDYQVREKLRGDILNIHKVYPITTIFVTHDIEEAFMLGKKIAVVNHGRVEQFGTREDVFYRPKTKNVAKFIGTRNIFNGVIKSINSRGITIYAEGIGDCIAEQKPDHELSLGQKVSFGIRPEDVIIRRSDMPLNRSLEHNLVDGTVTGIIGKGMNYTVYFKSKEDVSLKIDIPNTAFKRLNMSIDSNITVSLKKESIWIIETLNE